MRHRKRSLLVRYQRFRNRMDHIRLDIVRIALVGWHRMVAVADHLRILVDLCRTHLDRTVAGRRIAVGLVAVAVVVDQSIPFGIAVHCQR